MRKVIITVVSFAVLLGTAALPWTAVSQDAKPAAANSTYSVPSPAFTPTDSAFDYGNTGDLYLNSGFGEFRAPVFLPNGSKFRKIKLLCRDEGGLNIKMELWRVNILTHDFAKIGEVSSSGSDAGFRTFSSTAISPRTVNTLKYAYFLNIYFPGTVADGYVMRMVQIRYDAP